MGHCSKFGYALWAPAQMKTHTIRICDNFRSVGHSAGFDYALLWAILPTNYHCAELHTKYSACHVLPRRNDAKKCIFINSINLGVGGGKHSDAVY